ncbi:MAG: hypothetical protein PHY08_00065 [Candidatus Cloacimonetes bacterium]|jgi:16S rRNA processing protein RimM|nr:hypothetical protein [Candidatus Cloacimonadota bacterium]
MEISDLIKIGSLEFSHNNPKKIILKPKTEFQDFISNLKQVFLIFKDHRVRYVTVNIVEIIDEKQYYLEILDDDVIKEIKQEHSISLCLNEEDIINIDNSNQYFDPIGMKVVWNNQEVAIIENFFFNGAHDVYEIKMNDGKIVLIPDVEAFVTETNLKDCYIKVQDLDQFIDI